MKLDPAGAVINRIDLLEHAGGRMEAVISISESDEFHLRLELNDGAGLSQGLGRLDTGNRIWSIESVRSLRQSTDHDRNPGIVSLVSRSHARVLRQGRGSLMTTHRSSDPSRVEVIGSVKSYLGFFVLVVLVVEVVLGTLAATTEGSVQLLALGGMLFLITGLVAIVSFFAYCRPDVLLKSLSASSAGDPSPHEARMLAFRQQICGCWWNRLEPRNPDRLAIAHITPDAESGSVRLRGSSYDREGNVTDKWESVATCLHVNERKLFYYWRGSKPQAPNSRFEGFGEIGFHGTDDQLHSGNSMFSDTDLADVEKTVMKHARFWRLSEADAAVLGAGNPDHISRLIRERLAD